MNTIKKILLIGSGPIIIGQACEFDYSGVQACKTLRELNKYVVLLNSNPASIMTDFKLANKTYIEAVNLETVLYIIKKENIKYIMPGFGGQIALNLALELYKKKNIKIIEKYNIKILGASIKAIINSENRKCFREIMVEKKISIPYSKMCSNVKKCLIFYKKVKKISKEVVIRPSYTLGGLGSGISKNKGHFIKLCKKAIKISSEKKILIEESLYGWKEFELEILIDSKANFVVICAIENIDPVGIHTGDSITISPILTITDKEYQYMRSLGHKVIKNIGIRNCGCNIQFAYNIKNGKFKVIEVNPRVSRSSALASKITGYPIAKVSTKLSLNIPFDRIKNSINNNKFTAFFEPVIDYIAIKLPKFCNEKFIKNDNNFKLGPQMRSVGEIMAIGSNFNESLSKALRSLEDDFFCIKKYIRDKMLFFIYIKNNISMLYYIYDFIQIGLNYNLIKNITKIDLWFIRNIKILFNFECVLKINIYKKIYIKKKLLILTKKSSISDVFISKILKLEIFDILNLRRQMEIFPSYRRVDTCSGEFKTKIQYMYSTYIEFKKENKNKNNKVLIIGSGPNKIGQGLEFDYCCTHASKYIRKIKYRSVIVNCNPETISTDYDTSDELYFEPLNEEDIYNLIKKEKFYGTILQFGGQASLKFINLFNKFNIKVLGTNIKSIKVSEDREKFKMFLNSIKVLQPQSITISQKKSVKRIPIKFPVIIRPSFVLGGARMKIIDSIYKLNKYIKLTRKNTFPLLIDEFLNSASEYDIDCTSDGKNIYISEIIQHIEKAGIHSGDSTCFTPSYLSKKNKINIKKIIKKIAIKLNLIGLMNTQIAIKNKKVYILEVNLRASRTIPFISKSNNTNIIKISINNILKINKKKIRIKRNIRKYFFIKESVFSFIKFPKTIPNLGPEMKSTGEISCFSKYFEVLFLKAQDSANKYFKISKTIVFFIKKNYSFLYLLFKYLKKDNIRILVFKTKISKTEFKDIIKVLKTKICNILFQTEEEKINKTEKKLLDKIKVIAKNMEFALFTTTEATKCVINSLLLKVYIKKPLNLNNIYHDDN
ncbi:carbamoyl-phosphate synthase large subunit [Candidatus Vidania fulgoroideorum]